MDDIHTPSVASGPTTNGHSNGIAADSLSFDELMAEKARLEGELTSLGAVLESVRAYFPVMANSASCFIARRHDANWLDYFRWLSTRGH